MPHGKEAIQIDASFKNAAKTLFANIRFASVDDPIKTIMLTSAVPNEGKSTISTALAQAIASSDKHVLLIECDMRRPTLRNTLGVRGSSGLRAVLSGEVPLAEAIVATSTPNMYFLDAEPSIPNPADLLMSRRFAKAYAAIRDHYDYVVLDTPPVTTFVDAAILAAMVDATVLVARENATKRADALHAVEQLKKAGANIVGVVLNDCETSDHSSNYYAYYKPHDEGDAGSASHARPAEGKRFK